MRPQASGIGTGTFFDEEADVEHILNCGPEAGGVRHKSKKNRVMVIQITKGIADTVVMIGSGPIRPDPVMQDPISTKNNSNSEQQNFLCITGT